MPALTPCGPSPHALSSTTPRISYRLLWESTPVCAHIRLIANYTFPLPDFQTRPLLSSQYSPSCRFVRAPPMCLTFVGILKPSSPLHASPEAIIHSSYTASHRRMTPYVLIIHLVRSQLGLQLHLHTAPTLLHLTPGPGRSPSAPPGTARKHHRPDHLLLPYPRRRCRMCLQIHIVNFPRAVLSILPVLLNPSPQ